LSKSFFVGDSSGDAKTAENAKINFLGVKTGYGCKDKKGTISGQTVAIIGDIAHSRVARSNIWALTKMEAPTENSTGTEIYLHPWLPHYRYDLITWIKPFVGHRDYRESNRHLIESFSQHLKRRSMLVVAFESTEYQSCWEMISRIMLALDKEGIPFNVSLIQMEAGLKYFNEERTFDENVANGCALHPGECQARENLFVFSMGDVYDPNNHPISYSSYIQAYKAALEQEITLTEDAERKRLLELSLSIVGG